MRLLSPTPASLLLLGLVAAACGDSPASPAVVSELRILGMQMEPPDAVPGQTVTLSALVVDPEPGDVTLTWYACPTPVSAGEYFSGSIDTSAGLCPGDAGPYGDLIGTGDAVSFEVPDGFLDDAVALLEAEGWDNSDGGLDLLVSFLGWQMRVVLVAERADGSDEVESFKRLLVTGFGGFNTNPDPPSIHLQRLEDGEDPVRPDAQQEPPPDGECLVATSTHLGVAHDTTHFLTPVNLPDPMETYTQIDSDGEPVEVEEAYWFSWFSTHTGIFDTISSSGLPEIPWTVGAPTEDELWTDEDGEPYLPLWVVVRDGRGGLSWCEQRLPVTE